jgi:hypothetical protein
LSKKYSEIPKLVNRMTTAMVSPRPTCEQILNERKLWALSLSELKEDLNKFIVEEKPIEESFHHFFIKTKLNKVGLNSKESSLLFKSLDYLKRLF